MNHLKWMGHVSTIYDIQRNLRNELHTCEVTLVAKGFSVRAHRFVLSSCSDLLRNLLSDVPLGQEATIVIPDISGALLESVLSFIYVGETQLSSAYLSEFLEAISILGIKSAISFECTAATVQNNNNTHALPLKALNAIQLAHDDIIDQDNMVTPKIVAADSVVSDHTSAARDLEFLDVYNESQKITYSIEHMPVASNGSEFILTENTGTYTLTRQTRKRDNIKCTGTDKLDDDGDAVGGVGHRHSHDHDHEHDQDQDVDENIIEEYSSTGDPLIEIDESVGNASGVNTGSTIANAAGAATAGSTTAATATTLSGIQVMSCKPSKAKMVKLKRTLNVTSQDAIDATGTTQQLSTDPMTEITTTPNTTINTSASDSFTYTNHDAALEMAVNGVLNEGMSLQKAAVKFDVSKTVLWRRVRKNPNYMKTSRENPVLSFAYERIRRGDALKNISRDLDIPMSTLHRHKVRLAEQGRLPDYVTFKKRDPLSKNELKAKLSKAVHACVYEGMSQNHAANLFDIPKSTLWRHLQKRVAEAELVQGLEADVKKEDILA